MRSPNPGDRIVLVVMPDDPNPVTPGTKGTVNFVRRCGTSWGAWLQVDVDWDNGRKLMLAVPPDEFVLLPDDVN